MKIKTISRSEEEYTRERPTDMMRVFKNLDPLQHPFEKPKEYIRALNSVKLQKVFAKPFVGALQGHRDGVYSLAKHPKSLSALLSGSCDGEIRVWNLPFRTTVWHVKAHTGYVRGLSVSHSLDSFLSCGDDKTVKMWKFDPESKVVVGNKDEVDVTSFMEIDENTSKEPIATYLGKYPFTCIDTQVKGNLFVTCGSQVVEIWDQNKSNPIRTFEWGTDSVYSVAFNPVETNIIASCATDRSIALYDLRGSVAIRKVILSMKSNMVAWNPMEAFNFTCANEDHNLYTFDMRKLDKALALHKDHVSAVLSVDYAPTGKEFCSGSYDRSIRIFSIDERKSREIYHTRRMQRIFCAKYSADSRFVITGSDDTNIRLWKAIASDRLGTLVQRQKQQMNYNEALKERYKFAPQIKKIDKNRHLPKVILQAKKLRQVMEESQKKKLKNLKKHSKIGKITAPREKEEAIVTEVK